MFSKAALTFLAVGALSVNALTFARSPAPEPESQELAAWMLKRDLSYELFSRKLQALDELFSREPESWAEWTKREPSPGGGNSKPDPKPAPQPAPGPVLHHPVPINPQGPAVANFLKNHNK